jgi:hypothetical protein
MPGMPPVIRILATGHLSLHYSPAGGTMKNLRLNTLERMTLLQAIPQGGTLARVATYLRILEALRLKEDEQKAVGWQAHDNGTATVQDALGV